MSRLLKCSAVGTAILLGVLSLPAWTGERPFVFGSADLSLLDDANELDRQIKSRGWVSRDEPLNLWLRSLFSRVLAGQAPPDKVVFQVFAVGDPMVNAIALPNGSLYINTGLLAALENEAQLAGVMARESVHITERHAYLENRVKRVASVVRLVAPVSPFGLLSLAPGMVVANHSQQYERVADRKGMVLLAAAGYDPHAMPTMFQALSEKLELEPVTGAYRNPANLRERIAVTTGLAGSQQLPSQRAASTSDYLSHVAEAVCFNIGADLDSRRARTAVARANRLVTWRPDVPRYRVLLADSYRALGARSTVPDDNEQKGVNKVEQRRLLFAMTEEEAQSKLLAQRGGPETKSAHQTAAEKLYLDAIAQQPSLAVAHRGLAMLYQEQAKNDAAAAEYRRYLELAPADAADRLRIERRLESVAKVVAK